MAKLKATSVAGDLTVTGKVTSTVSGATTSTIGTVKLNDATNSTSTTTAATANAVKKAYDLANGKANSSHGNHVPATQTANSGIFLRNDNTWQTVNPDSIGAARGSKINGTTAATTGWYRIAQTGTDVGNNTGTFMIRASASGKHSSTILTVGITYGQNPTVQQLSHTQYSTSGITKARIVYHKTYAGTRAYLEVYIPDATARTIEVQLTGTLGWSLLNPSTAGSVPSGYSNKEITLATNKIVSDINGTINGYTVSKSVPSNAVFTDTKYSNATTSASGLMSNTDKSKLDGIATGANKYVHPSDANTRHVTDVEKGVWNGTKAELDALKDQVSQNKPIVITDDTAVGTIAFIDSAISVQEGWLKCDGSTLSTTQYKELFDAIGYIHGGSGTSFKLPDLRVGNLVIEGIDDAETTMDAKVVKRQIGIIKAKKLGKDMLTVAQEWTGFKENGGEIGGSIRPSDLKAPFIGVIDSSKTLSVGINVEKQTDDYLGFHAYDEEGKWEKHILRLYKDGTLTCFNDVNIPGESKTANGYTKLPNGMIMQWVTLNIAPRTEEVLYYPVNFPNGTLVAIATPRGNRADGAWSIPWWDNYATKIWNGSSIEINYWVIAIGY